MKTISCWASTPRGPTSGDKERCSKIKLTQIEFNSNIHNNPSDTNIHTLTFTGARCLGLDAKRKIMAKLLRRQVCVDLETSWNKRSPKCLVQYWYLTNTFWKVVNWFSSNISKENGMTFHQRSYDPFCFICIKAFGMLDKINEWMNKWNNMQHENYLNVVD